MSKSHRVGGILTQELLNPKKSPIYRDLLLVSIFTLVVTIDQFTKMLVRANLHIHESIPSEGIFRFTYTTNTGAVFGIFSDQVLIMTLASFVGVGILLYFYHSYSGSGRFVRISLGLLLGGAVGNLVDRVLMGRVTDFIDVGVWPIFNLADSAIVTGITILIALFLFEKEKPNTFETGSSS